MMRLTKRLKAILIAIAVIAVSFLVSLKAMDWLSPRGTSGAPALAQLPPLPPASRSKGKSAGLPVRKLITGASERIPAMTCFV